jgi:exonuclease III
MRIVTWNVDKRLNLVKHLKDFQADVLLLQEVRLSEELQRGLSEQGFIHQIIPDSQAATDDRTCSAVFSRTEIEQIPTPSDFEMNHLFVAVKLGSIDVVSCHIPNGSQYGGDVKQRHLLAAARWISERLNRLMAGDFNEPELFRNGRALSWANKDPAFDGWREAVSVLFNNQSVRHLCKDLHTDNEPASWRSKGRVSKVSRWYDHALWSGQTLVAKTIYLHDFNYTRKASDHSPLLIDLSHGLPT